MQRSTRHYYLWWMLGVAILTCALDQCSKAWVLGQFMDTPHSALTVTSFFNMVLVWNSGVSFGLFAGHNQPYIFAGISAVIIIMLLGWLRTCDNRRFAAAIGAVIGGAIGNVVDRLRFGAVVDFLDFHWDTYHWPAFNLADSFIFIGVVLLCLSSMFTPISTPCSKS